MSFKVFEANLERARKLSPPEMVNEFQTTFKAGVSKTPKLPSKEQMLLRSMLIEEEAKEFREACEDNDFIEAADALGDLLYVVLGGFIVFGLVNGIDEELMAQIHASNMSKLCVSVEEAQAFIDETTDKDGPIYYYEETTEGRVVLYWAYGPKKDKVAKGPHYIAPDLSFLIQE